MPRGFAAALTMVPSAVRFTAQAEDRGGEVAPVATGADGFRMSDDGIAEACGELFDGARGLQVRARGMNVQQANHAGGFLPSTALRRHTRRGPTLSRRHRYDAGLDRRISHMFIHTVYFWLRPGTSEDAKAQLVRDCREYLGKVPSVKQLMVGVPAMTPREVVDN